ncbi:GntR family transcriptional regulator, partial [Singulisphaera rosea]
MGVRRDSIRGEIRRVLVKRILDGTYKPGDRLLELQIAREFQTSQGPVREALRELEALRLVESQTYRGTRV